MSIPEFEEIIEQNDQTEARREHLDAMRELVGNVYPNKFTRSNVSGVEDTITNILKYEPVVGIVNEIKAIVATLAERERPPAEIKDALNARLREFGNVRISGRLAVPPRVMGKAAFVHLSDGMSRLQIYVRRDDIRGIWNGSEPGAIATGFLLASTGNPVAIAPGSDPNGWEIFQLLDHGDFIGVEGYLFITNTGELSVHVETLQFLAKAMLPMPDKMHGIADAEIKQRQRYVDLIGSSLRVESHESGVESESELTTRQVFERRAKVISSMRHFLEDHGYIEVETPMLTPKATGAVAKPFKTHHNALDIDLYARIAPELYLKRLVVGGFEKVYELNRNFRNEGLSYKHNPEFTMLEFYCAYMDVNGMMDFCKEMLQESVRRSNNGSLKVTVEKITGPVVIDFENFDRVSMKNAVSRVLAQRFSKYDLLKFEESLLDDYDFLVKVILYLRRIKTAADSIHPIDQIAGRGPSQEEWLRINKENWDLATIEAIEEQVLFLNKGFTKDQLILEIFDRDVENELIQPTFVIDYPRSISPLSKASPENPNIAERFELFINGMEVANGFSELNDPKEQYDRFIDQMGERERGDEEAMILDEDYIRALSYGMPPAAGIGIGIDRLVMLLTNKHSIRDVILFPHMRPEKRDGEKGSGGEGES